MPDPSTRSVIGTTLNFYEDVALGLNWYGLYVRESRKWKAANAMNDLLDMIEGDKDKRIKLNQDDIRKFRCLYWEGVYLVQKWNKMTLIEMPEAYTIAYSIENKKIEVETTRGKQLQMAMVMETDFKKDVPLWEGDPVIKEMLGFMWLSPRNPVRSKTGVFTTFILIHAPVPISDGWAGYEKLQVLKNASFYINEYNPVTHQIVEKPINVDFGKGTSEIVSTIWHSRVVNLLWREMSRVMGRIKVDVTEELSDKDIDLVKVYENSRQMGSLIKSLGAPPSSDAERESDSTTTPSTGGSG